MTNWPTKKLGEVCEIRKGKKPHLYKEGGADQLPYLTAEVLRNGTLRQFASTSDRNSVPVSEREVIIICDGSNSGDVFLGHHGILASTMGKLIHSDQVYTKYLYLFLKQNFEYLNTDKVGAATPHLNQDKFKNLKIPLPPLAEQKRIVAKIEKIFTKIDQAERLRKESLSASSALLPSAMHQVFNRAEKENWPTKKLGEVAEIVVGKTPARDDYLNDGNFKVLKYRDIKRSGISWATSEKGFVKRPAINGLKEIKVGDVLITSAGHTSAKIGEDAAVIKAIPKEFQKVYFASELICYRPNQKLLIPEWLLIFLHSENGQEQIKKIVGGSVHLTGTKSQNLQIPLPPLAEQKKIVAYLDSLSAKARELQNLQQQTAADFFALRQSILAKAFAGGL